MQWFKLLLQVSRLMSSKDCGISEFPEDSIKRETLSNNLNRRVLSFSLGRSAARVTNTIFSRVLNRNLH